MLNRIMCISALPNFTQMGLEVRKFRLEINVGPYVRYNGH